MRKGIPALLLALALIAVPGCAPRPSEARKLRKFSTRFYGTFDTVVQLVGYAESEDGFRAEAEAAEKRFRELDALFDIYHSRSGLRNLKTVNDAAGKEPVPVAPEILDLVEYGISWYGKTGGAVNIAMGSVLSVWHEMMALYAGETGETALPSEERLRKAAEHTDITKVRVDREAGTVFLEDPGMSLDVGAVAKGFAAETVAREAAERGFTRFILSAGGNVVAGDGPPGGGRSEWAVGIQNPDTADDPDAEQCLDVVFIRNGSVVTSGDYQRYYWHDGRRIHHIIDPRTLMPAGHFRAVTVVAGDSGEADVASTALFNLPFDESAALAERMGWKALWVLRDGTLRWNGGMGPLLRDRGGADGR